jgi:hypothetical protein
MTKFNISAVAMLNGALVIASNGAALTAPAQSEHWETPAKWHQLLKKAVLGTLVVDAEGVEFHSAKFNQRWPNAEIHSFELSTREFTITSYQNRRWHEPGEQRFQFTLSEPMPAEVAAELAERVGKPVRNGVPLPSVAELSEIPAHHRTWSGGSSGTLRLKDTGIDYLTEDGRDSRAWRWADIQTIANPNPYELRVTAYRETVEFDLKQPLPRTLFELLWDRLYAVGLNLFPAGGGAHQ